MTTGLRQDSGMVGFRLPQSTASLSSFHSSVPPANIYGTGQGWEMNSPQGVNPSLYGAGTKGLSNQGQGLFGTNMSGFDMARLGLGVGQLGLGLYQAHLGRQGLKHAKNMFGFEKLMAQAGYRNQAKLINNSYDSSAQVAAAMAGGGLATPGLMAQHQAVADQRKVNPELGG